MQPVSVFLMLFSPHRLGIEQRVRVATQMVTILNLMMLINSNGNRRRFSSDCCCSCKILLVFTANVKETKGK